MREYKIKKGYHPDIEALVDDYFGEKGDIEEGIEFETEGIGKIHMKRDGKSFYVDIDPPEKPSGDYSIIKKWNKFLYEATGRTAKERKKRFGKVKKK
ncbi:MAG: DUF5611 family protein [Candidatus Thermoplasmatota archaeon]